MRKLGIYMLILALLAAVLPGTALAAEDVLIEGEAFESTNASVSTSLGTDPALSGSNFAAFNIGAEVAEPEEGFYVEYTVELPEAGAYEMEIVSTPLAVEWASQYGISVNGGGKMKVGDGTAQQMGMIDSSVYRNTFAKVHVSPMGGFKKGENKVRVYAMQRRPQDNRFVAYIDYIKFSKVPWGLSRIQVKDDVTLGIYEEGMQPAFDILYYEGAPEDRTVSYTVTDFWGEAVKAEDILVKAGEPQTGIVLDALPKGHYTITANEKGSTEQVVNYFSIVTPLEQRVKREGTPFAMDAAVSWLAPADKMAGYAKAEALAGIEWVRERFRWNTSNPAPDEYDYNAGNYDAIFRDVHDQGVKILPLSSNVASFSKAAPEDTLSDDLINAYKYAKNTADHFDGVVQAWEMWNEPELSSTHDYETADRLAALVKALAVGFGDSEAHPYVSTPGLAYPPAHYAETMIRNEVMDYADIYNYHNHLTYSEAPVLRLPGVAKSHMNLLYKYGAEEKQVWLTEAGTYVPFREGKAELELDQQQRYANYLVVSTVDSLAAGNDLHFWFVLPYYVEAGRMLGIFSQSHTPYSAYSAEANLTDVLGEGKYVGLMNGLPSDTTGYIFESDGHHIAVLFSETEREIQLPVSAAEHIDIMGGVTALEGDGSITVTVKPEPCYVRLDGKFDESIYTKDGRKSIPLAEIERPSFTPAQRVILDQKYPAEARAGAKVEGYHTNLSGTTVTVDVNNLNDKAMKGTIFGETFAGWEISPASADVSVEPFSKKKLTFTVRPTGKALVNTASTVKFYGEFDGEKTSNSVASIILEGEDTPVMDRTFDGTGDIANWHDNIAGIGKTEMTKGAVNGSIQFKFDFTGTGDKWAFPFFNIPETADYRGTKGVLIDIEASEDMETAALFRILITEQNGCKYFTSDGFTIGKGRQYVMIPWTKFSAYAGVVDDNFNLDLHLMRKMEVGVNARRDDVPAYTIHSIGVYNGATIDYYSEPMEITPANGTVIEEKQPQIQVVFSQKDVDIEPDTLRVFVDKERIDHTFDEETRTLTAMVPQELAEGAHALDIAYRCEDAQGFLKGYNFEINTNVVEFTDIDGVAWVQDSILQLAKAGVVKGVGGNRFAPQETLTRAQFVKMAVDGFALQADQAQCSYTDVQPTAWYYDAVATAQTLGLLEDVAADAFYPDAPISRQDMAAVLYRTALKAGVSLQKTVKKQVFLDKGAFAPYAQDAIAQLQLAGIVAGRADRYFYPNDGLTRAEGAVAMQKLYITWKGSGQNAG